MPYICQDHLPLSPWMSVATSKLPGVQPVKADNFFLTDDAFEPQMKYRENLFNTKRDKVFFDNFEIENACIELLDFVIFELKKNDKYSFNGNKVTRPDGVEVNLLKGNPLVVAAHLVQEDLLLLRKEGSEHVLRAGVLCFPASWTLSEKKNKSLTSIHGPVAEYGANLASRIEKMFSNLKPETPIWRGNFLLYDNPELFQPRLEKEEKGNSHKTVAKYLRVERQTLKKLPLALSTLTGTTG